MQKIAALTKRKKHDVDMTQGNIAWHLIRFALPLLVGNIFQQLYNTVDTWVVGNYVSNEAYAAVGTMSPVINMLIGIFTGLATGAGVVISQYYGAKNDEKVANAVHTSIMLTMVLSVVLTAIGISLTPYMLRMMKVPEEVMPEAVTYLTIYFAGLTGLLFYNMGAGILRAVGDSNRPFYFLLVSTFTNIVLDLLFVIGFGMGVEGVAYATIISQFISAVLVVIVLMRANSSVRIVPRKVRFHMDMLKKIVSVGLPASVQMAITAFSNIFVQSYIYQFGTDVMSGWTTYTKVDMLVLLPMSSLGLASTTFVGQNLGCGQVQRAKRGITITMVMTLLSTGLIAAGVMIFASPLAQFFNKDPKVIEIASLFLRVVTPWYLVCSVNQIYSGALRGSGDTTAPTIIMLLSFVAFRQLYMFVVSTYISNTLIPLTMSYPAGWLVCSTLTYIYYKCVPFGRKVVVAKSEIKAS